MTPESAAEDLPVVSRYTVADALTDGTLIPAAAAATSGAAAPPLAATRSPDAPSAGNGKLPNGDGAPLSYTLADIILESRFALGRIVYTNGVHATVEEGALDPLPYLARHSLCDWGDLDAHDQRMNQQALREGLRLLSAYDTPAGKIYIITEADRSVTTILFSREY